MGRLYTNILLAVVVLSAYLFAGCACPSGQTPEWYCEQGNILAGQDSYHEALAKYDEAIEHNPLYAEAYINRGVTYFELGQLERSIRDYSTAIRLNPQCAEAYYNRGYSYFELGQLERSMQDYNEAIRLNPQFAWAYANRARIYTLLNMDTEAQQDVNKAIELGCDPTILNLEMESLKEQR